jgi:cystinosin
MDAEMADRSQDQSLLHLHGTSSSEDAAPAAAASAAELGGDEASAEKQLDITKIVSPDGVFVCGCWVSTRTAIIIGGVICAVAALGLGLGLTPPTGNPAWKVVSSICGWFYFMLWSISFFPQIITNWARKSVIGQNADYLALNVLGFSFYSIFNCCFYFSSNIQAEYKDRFDVAQQVQANDVAFSVGALVLTLFNVYQYCIYERGAQTVARPFRIFIVFCVVVVAIWGIIIAAGVRTKYFFVPLDLLYGLGLVKLAVTLIKYVPQICLTYRRKTSVGWNIANVLLDISGGLLSVAQELFDAGEKGDWVSIAGNPIKFGLGTFSVVYDIIMLVQHYCMYAENNKKLEDEAREKLREAQGAAA